MANSVRRAYKTTAKGEEMTPENLTSARRTLGMNKAQMAARLQTPYRTYQDWELGNRPVPGICAVAVRLLLKADAALMQSIKNELNRKFSHDLPERAQKM